MKCRRKSHTYFWINHINILPNNITINTYFYHNFTGSKTMIMATIKIPLTTQISSEQLERLKQISGVESVNISDETQLVILLHNEESNVISQILNKISDINSELTVEESNFPIEKLSCEGCATSAERLLNNQPGVVTASVKFPTKSAKIYYLQNQTTPLKLKIALEQLGYDLVVE
jgi:copper chaperone CopZ